MCIYKHNGHIKQEIDTQNLRPLREYYTSTTSFLCAVGCNYFDTLWDYNFIYYFNLRIWKIIQN